jgi:uncharacterized repeat protein (TIGR03837 family)
VDDAGALAWMAPDLAAGLLPGVQCHDWSQATEPAVLAGLRPSDVWIEAFGCELPEAFIAHGVSSARSRGQPQPAWINLEYLSAEPWVERSHGLPSPVMSGPARGWVKRFFYPGFTGRTGGLLREHDLMAQQADFDRAAHRHHLLLNPHDHSAASSPKRPKTDHALQRLISLFCYEPVGLPDLLRAWQPDDWLLVTPGRALAAVQAASQASCGLSGHELPSFALGLPHTDQDGFDRLLWACDLNFVRGEDSLVRALWAGQPLVWHIYPQHDHAHHAKLEAFLDWLDAPTSLRLFSRVWNGIAPGPLPALSPTTLSDWADCVRAARQRLLAQRDLLEQLQDMAQASPAG